MSDSRQSGASRAILNDVAQLLRIDAAETCIDAMEITKSAARLEQLAELADDASLDAVLDILVEGGFVKLQGDKVTLTDGPIPTVMPLTGKGGLS